MSDIGQKLQADFFDNTGGLNQSDAVFRVQDNQAVDGANYNYANTGGISKRFGNQKINTVADTQLKSFGISQHVTIGGTKAEIRAAGTKIQVVDQSIPSFTNLASDNSTAGTDFLSPTTTQPVVFSQFNTANANTLWMAGGGMTHLYGVVGPPYKVTQNGVPEPTNAAGFLTLSAGGVGGTIPTGTYFYSIVYHKSTTGALSNASLDASVAVTLGQKVTITLSGLTNNDTTEFDQIWIFRSTAAGVEGFTAGTLVAEVANGTATYVDDGTGDISDAVSVPRAGGTVDNSMLPDGTINSVATFKRQLVVAIESTVYFSDVNKPESWGILDNILVPSGGPVTALSVVSFTTAGSASIDELLVIFKEKEIWIVTGDTPDDFILKFIDSTGCTGQSLVVNAIGFLAWIDYRGIYLWDGTSKPIYASRPLEPIFATNGYLDKTKLTQGVATFSRRFNTVTWYLSHKIYGTQKYQITLDLRLTVPAVASGLTERVMDGIFIQGSTPFAIYASTTFIPTDGTEHTQILGDDSGFIYEAQTGFTDGGSGINFTYKTKQLDLGNPILEKRFHYVVVWVEEVGNWNLTLDYWTDYASAMNAKSTRAQQISTVEQSAIALWDVAVWDVAFWDDYTQRLKPLWFILASDSMNASEGKAIQLQFRNTNASEPINIHGFSVLYTTKSIRLGV